jgi:hypothetical protein
MTAPARFRYITVRSVRYLHTDDVVAYLRELGATEGTDVRNRLYAAANNLAISAMDPTKGVLP